MGVIGRAGLSVIVSMLAMMLLCPALVFEPALAQDNTPTVSGDQGNNQDDTCPEATEMVSIESATDNQREAFTVTGESFRVSYEVTFEASNDLSNDFLVRIEDEFGLVESDSTSSDDTRAFIVPEGPGDFEVVTDIEPENGATYTLTVDDCAGIENGNGDEDTGDEDTDDDGVIDDTIPKKPLPDTGGSTALMVGGSALLLLYGVLVAWRLKIRER